MMVTVITKKLCVSKAVEELDLCTPFVYFYIDGNEYSTATMQNSMQFPPNTKNENCHMIHQSYFLVYCICKRIKIKISKHICTPVFASVVHYSQ